MFKHETTIRICYADTDQMGFVYYGNFPKFFEIGRVEAIRSLGVSYKELEETGIIMPVSEIKIKYLKPAKYDDLICVETVLMDYPDKHYITFSHKIFNANKVLLTKGEVRLYILQKENMRLGSLPKKILDRLKTYYQG